MENPFVLPTQEYGRDLNILERYYQDTACLLYTSPSQRDRQKFRIPSSA